MQLNNPIIPSANQSNYSFSFSEKKSEEFLDGANILSKNGIIPICLKIPTRFDLIFTKLTHLLMKHGKKTKATQLVFNMLLILKKRIKKDGEKKNQKAISLNVQVVELIFQALENITPSLEVRKVRVAGSTYLVPAVLSKKKQEKLALKWLIESAKKRQKNSNGNFSQCLADEFLDASRKGGYVRQKRDELHRLAQQNRAYIRYRWW